MPTNGMDSRRETVVPNDFAACARSFSTEIGSVFMKSPHYLRDATTASSMYYARFAKRLQQECLVDAPWPYYLNGKLLAIGDFIPQNG
jgi:hypothetical protein